MTRRESLLACAGIIAGWVAAVAGHSAAHAIGAEAQPLKEPCARIKVFGKLADGSLHEEIVEVHGPPSFHLQMLQVLR